MRYNEALTLGITSKHVEEFAKLTKPSVITINGFYGRPHQFLRLHYGIWEQNQFQVLPYFYYPRAFTLDEHANDLAKVLRNHKSHSKINRTHFLTHSYGALVLRKAFQKLDWDEQKSRVVMIAPPNRGSYFARKLFQYNLGMTALGRKAGRELGEWSAEYIDSFAGNLPRSCETLVIAGSRGWNPFLPSEETHDGRVLVSETRLKTPHYFEMIPASHGLLLYHPRTIETTVNFLLGGLEPWDWEEEENENTNNKTHFYEPEKTMDHLTYPIQSQHKTLHGREADRQQLSL